MDFLNEELKGINDVNHPGHSLFYEFNSNESTNPDDVFISCTGCLADNSRISWIFWHYTEPGISDALPVSYWEIRSCSLLA